MTDAPPPRWLDPAEKNAWTALISLALLTPGRLEQPLQARHGLTLFEYLALSQMSEAPGRCLRMSELAHLANGSLSRLSNVVKRFERRGLVERFPDPDDGRFTLVRLLDAGLDVVVEAAPTHVAAVRDVVLDRLSPTDQQDLTRIAAAILTAPAISSTDAEPIT